MDRDAMQDETQTRANRQRRDTWWLSALEREIKRRIGWVDEAVSPFARRQHLQKAGASIREAA